MVSPAPPHTNRSVYGSIAPYTTPAVSASPNAVASSPMIAYVIR